MVSDNEDLHGNAPDRAPAALMIIDMINDLEWCGGKEILPHAVTVAEHIAVLKRRAHGIGVPVIYANDNFGRWRSDFREVVEHCLANGARGKRLAELLRPGKDDYFSTRC
jgi:nicotinamidase-related amidase